MIGKNALADFLPDQQVRAGWEAEWTDNSDYPEWSADRILYLDIGGQMYVVGNPQPFMAMPGAPTRPIQNYLAGLPLRGNRDRQGK
jgi:hypothetical protein